MYEQALKKLQKAVRRFSRKHKGGSMYVFGVSEPSRYVIRELLKCGDAVCGVIDNDVRKQHMYCGGIPVIGNEEFMEDCKMKRNICVLIISPFWREMKRQVIMDGIDAAHIKEIRLVSVAEETFLLHSIRLMQGREIYRKIVKPYGADYRIFLCPYTGTGDIYLIGTFFRQYLRAEKIDKYVFVVVSKACKRVADLFEIQNVTVLPDTDKCSMLISYYMAQPDICRMDILNDSWGEIYTNPIQWIRGYRGHNFTDMFRRYVFRLPESAKPQPPRLKDEREAVYGLFCKNHFPPGKTVILSPYASTLADMPMDFWEKLARLLQKKGYTVCTNSSGEKEPAVAGTKAVFFPLSIAPQMVECGGTFIGIRSGFCDVISSAKARKIILYDKNNWFYNCRAYEYFSLNGMGLCEDAVEIEFEWNETDAVIQKIDQYI